MVRKIATTLGEEKGCHPRMDGMNRLAGPEPFVITYHHVTKAQERRASHSQSNRNVMPRVSPPLTETNMGSGTRWVALVKEARSPG